MNDIQVNARFNIQPGKIEEFKKIAHDCIEAVNQKDKGTLQYDWFYNDQRSECVVRERYAGSEAVLDHIANVGDLLVGLLAVATIALEIYGNPSADVKNSLDGWDVTNYYFEEGK